jgi:hypothetical protein
MENNKILVSVLHIEDIDPTADKLEECAKNLGLFYYLDSSSTESAYIYIFKTSSDKFGYFKVVKNLIKAKKNNEVINNEEIETIEKSYRNNRRNESISFNVYSLKKYKPLFKIRLSDHPDTYKRRIQNEYEATIYIDFEGMSEEEITTNLNAVKEKMKEYSSNKGVLSRFFNKIIRFIN